MPIDLDKRKLLKLTALTTLLPLKAFGVKLHTVKLLVLRKPAVLMSDNCLAPCIRGSIFDVSHISDPLDVTAISSIIYGEPICDTIERPWKNNQSNISSIPVGKYTARIRNDKSKGWMTKIDRSWRLELIGTGRRANIQFHYGRDEKWSAGCFIVGKHLTKAAELDDLAGSYCKLSESEAAVKKIRDVVLNKNYDNSEIIIYVSDDERLFPDFRSETTKC